MAEMVKPEQKLANLKDLLGRMGKQMALALPSHMKAERMARIALTACLKNPTLLECDVQSFAGAMLVLAQLGLEPDGNEAHLVPFRNKNRGVLEVQVIPDYKGLAKLARQSGEIKMMDWREVRQGDHFKYEYGSKAFIEHRPDDKPIHVKSKDGWAEARPITHCYALAILDSGETVFEVMRWEDVEFHRDRYSKAAGSGPWITEAGQMGAKTCFRRLSKRLPRSTGLLRAVELDDKAEAAIPQDLGAVFTADMSDDPAVKDAPAAGVATAGPQSPAVEEVLPGKTSKLDAVTGALKERNGKPKVERVEEPPPAQERQETPPVTESSGSPAKAPETAVRAPHGPVLEPSSWTTPITPSTVVERPSPPAPGASPLAASLERNEVISKIEVLMAQLKLTPPERGFLENKHIGKLSRVNVPIEKLEALKKELQTLADRQGQRGKKK